MEKKFVANKALIINAQGKILLVRDAGKLDHAKSKGKFDFPGGRMDEGETPQEGLARELKEELGLDANKFQIDRPFFTGLWGVGGDSVNKPIIGIFYIVRPVGELEITLSDEHTEFIWFDPHTKYQDDFPDGVRVAVDAYRKQEGIIVGADQSIKGREGYGLIQVITGNGKGKTTSSLGTAIRCAGANKKVGIVYFDKGGNTHYSERKLLDTIDNITYIATGRDRIDPDSGRFDFSINDTDKSEATRGIEVVKEMFTQDYDLIILDEINSTTNLGIIDVQVVIDLLENKPEHTELILTGRNAPQEFLNRAHLVTNMHLQKHYFYSGVPAREGIDY
jgi:cob(I)alamin adenosyltransferase